MINTDYTQYKSFAEANEHAKLVSKEVISDVKTELQTKCLEDLQKQEVAHEK